MMSARLIPVHICPHDILQLLLDIAAGWMQFEALKEHLNHSLTPVDTMTLH